MRTLLLMRHAKSDWAQGGASDIERLLNERGKKAAVRMGQWLVQQQLYPAVVVCSIANRTRETLSGLRRHLNINAEQIHFEQRAYLADVQMLLQLIAEQSESSDQQHPVLLIAHNPGLEALLVYLCGTEIPLSASGKLVPSATIAQIQLPDSWYDLRRGCGSLQCIVRPGELDRD
ncbi:MAG: histidine phosphatase family protein [Gammaproteobacteria bacterium]|nr:histidine phosphatase family protein [Gammaproteobacteria bacterium]